MMSRITMNYTHFVNFQRFIKDKSVIDDMVEQAKQIDIEMMVDTDAQEYSQIENYMVIRDVVRFLRAAKRHIFTDTIIRHEINMNNTALLHLAVNEAKDHGLYVMDHAQDLLMTAAKDIRAFYYHEDLCIVPEENLFAQCGKE